MKKTLKFAALLLGIFSMICMTSCKKDNEDLIIGKWNVTGMTANGMTINPSQMGMTMTWEFKKDNTGSMNMTMNYMGQQMTESDPFNYTIDGDKITFTLDNEAATATIKTLDKKVLEFEVSGFDEEEGAMMNGIISCERM